MATYYLKSITGTAGSGTGRTVWAAGTAYVAGDRVVSTRSATAARQFKVYECTTGGTSHATTEPTWDSTTGNTTTDNTVTWTCRAATTWANAHMFLDMLLQGGAAGDTIYVSHQHDESSSVGITMLCAGSTGQPIRVICVNDGAEPPTAVATTGIIGTTGTSSIITYGDAAFYGLTFKCGTGAGAPNILFNAAGGARQIFERCVFEFVATGAGRIDFATTANAISVFKACNVKFAGTGQRIGNNSSLCVWDGGEILSGSSAITALFNQLYGLAEFRGLDLSNAAASMNFVPGGATSAFLVISDSKLPASWSGSLISGTVSGSQRAEMYNCDAGDTNYRIQVQDAYGLLTQETTLVRTGGASDGTTSLAWKIVSTSSAKFDYSFCSPEIVRWNETTGSAITATVEILHDSATNLTDAEVWLEVMYLGTSGVPLGTWTSDRAADILATPADQATSSETWTTTGMSNPNKQKLSVTITPQEKGFLHARVCVAKASKTLYVCPRLEIT